MYNNLNTEKTECNHFERKESSRIRYKISALFPFEHGQVIKCGRGDFQSPVVMYTKGKNAEKKEK